MAKPKINFVCEACGAVMPKWVGQCPNCQAWGQIVEEKPTSVAKQYRGYATSSQISTLAEVTQEHTDERIHTGLKEFDRVLGGGLVKGSGILLGGDPGIGKSTILLQMIGTMQEQTHCLYVSGEESVQQIASRARRLGLKNLKSQVMSDTDVMAILAVIDAHKPKLVVIDSIQTMSDPDIQAAPGSVSQIRACTQRLLHYGKSSQVTFLLVGHVTKEGQLAGPRVLEHMVDTVLYFEGDRSSRYRMIRAVKNRYGPAHELGVFVMEPEGLQEVSNPSAIFLERFSAAPGRVVTALWEGTRTVLAEVQALVTPTYTDFPKRVTVGFDHQRMSLLLAILSRYCGLKIHQMDVFMNVVGGLRIQETAADSALLMAVWSSAQNIVIPADILIMGEVGLSGELRPVPEAQQRINEAKKQGFTSVLMPSRNKVKSDGLTIYPAERIGQYCALLKKLLASQSTS